MVNSVRINLKSNTDTSYDVRIGVPLADAAREIRRNHSDSTSFIITDSNVEKLYGRSLLGMIDQPASHMLVVPAGEKSKNRKSKAWLEDKLISLNATRNSMIIALGGGVIGDLAGFVASTLLRGVPYIQLPTTLLAQVDSSIGGKVAIDHPLGKNLIGAFHQPEKVYIDPLTLKTLPDAEFINGMAEVIKYGAILDKSLFAYLEENNNRIKARVPGALQYIIKRCCTLKRSIVERDEKETGPRRILNFGHTIGHALESLSHYRLSHGQAVAIGMVAEAWMSVRLGLLSAGGYQRLERVIAGYHLPTRLPSGFSLQSILRATARDKKNQGGSVHYTLLDRIGKARIGVPLTSVKAHELFAS
jgi:3-dehydroquinate synthase